MQQDVAGIRRGRLSNGAWSAGWLGVICVSAMLIACDARSTSSDGANATASTATAAGGAAMQKVSADGAAAIPAGGQTRAQVYETVKKMTAVGKQLFFDPSLSGSGKLACASCHSPQHAFGPPNALSVQLGGQDMRQQGMRAA